MLENRGGIFRFHDSGEDDGTRLYDKDMVLVCDRCRTRMKYLYDEEQNVDYAQCPKCGFIEIEDYNDDPEDTDYETYWPDSDEE